MLSNSIFRRDSCNSPGRTNAKVKKSVWTRHVHRRLDTQQNKKSGMCVIKNRKVLYRNVCLYLKAAKYTKWRRHWTQSDLDLKISTTVKFQFEELSRLLKFTSSSTFTMNADNNKRKKLLQNRVWHEWFTETNSKHTGCTGGFVLKLNLLL